MKFTQLGHAGLLVETGSTRVLIDPGTFSDVSGVETVDAVLVTHQHPDHLDVAAVKGLVADGVPVHADPGSVKALAAEGVTAETTTPGSDLSVGDIVITAVGEKHAFIHPYVPVVRNVGLVLEADGVRLFHPGDALDAEPGTVDYLAVPVNAPWAAVRDAIEFVRRIEPTKGVIPIHDALLSETGRTMYLTHIGTFGLDGGVKIVDGADRRAHDLT